MLNIGIYYNLQRSKIKCEETYLHILHGKNTFVGRVECFQRCGKGQVIKQRQSHDF